MKTQEIVKHITELENNPSYDGRYKIKYALSSTLPDTAFMKFIEDEGFPEIYDKSLTRRGLNNRFSCRQRNAIEKEIKELSSPQCKRKVALKDNLKKRFRYAFPKDQERVLRCMLYQPSIKERQWAYSKMNAAWDKWCESFTDDIITIFERFKDSECATLIVRHLPVSYVYENREILASKVGWQRVIAAIGKKYPETIDFSKLNSNENVRTIVKLGLTEQRGYIEDVLYSNILREIEYIISAGKCADSERLTASDGKFHNHHLVPIEERSDFYSEKEWGNTGKAYLTYYFGVRPPDVDYCNFGKILSLRDIGGVSLVLWAMGRLGMAEEIVQFSKYDIATEEYLKYSSRDCQTVPAKVETWLFKTYNYILTTRYGEQPLSDDEMVKRFVDQSLENEDVQSSDISQSQPIEIPAAFSEQVRLLEDIGFVATKMDYDVPF